MSSLTLFIFLVFALCFVGMVSVRGEEMELNAVKEGERIKDEVPIKPDSREMHPQWWEWNKNKWNWHDDDKKTWKPPEWHPPSWNPWSWRWDGSHWSWGQWGNSWSPPKAAPHWSWKDGKWNWGW